MPYEVPPLPYDYNALEPHIDEQTMHLHHDKHHQAYVTNLNAAIDATTEQLWLQTSEGPHGTPGKTQLLAQFVAVVGADHKAAHPTPHPVTCG